MAFALFSVFEPSIVKKIYEMILEPDTIDVMVSYYPHPWDRPTYFNFTVPKDAKIYDLKNLISNSSIWSYAVRAELRLRVDQPWNQKYQEVDSDEDVLEYHEDYEEFYLGFDSDGGS